MKQPNCKLTVAGCGISLDSMHSDAIKAVESAEILAGGKRLLALFPDFKGKTIELDADLTSKIPDIISSSIEKKTVILASGDPLFCGIGAMLKNINGLKIIPAVTAFQEFFSRIKEPWNDFSFFTLHGKKETPDFRNILASPKALIYCDNKNTASIIADKLIAFCPSAKNRPAAAAENLGLKNESVIRGTLASIAKKQFSGLSMLLLFQDNTKISDDGIFLGLPDSEFHVENRLITHPEIRAICLSKLRLGSGVLWDVGAGSGSVSLEACGLCDGLHAFAIEQYAERCRQIKANLTKHGQESKVTVINGLAPEAFEGLPRPRAVFAGGGGRNTADILAAAYKELLPGGRIVVPAVLLETRATLTNIFKDEFIEALSISVSRSEELAGQRMMKSENPVEIYVFGKKEELHK